MRNAASAPHVLQVFSGPRGARMMRLFSSLPMLSLMAVGPAADVTVAQKRCAKPVTKFGRRADIPHREIGGFAGFHGADLVFHPERLRGVARHAGERFLRRQLKQGAG